MYRYDKEADDWSSERSEVSKIAISVLMIRCEYILKRFIIDEKDLGAYRVLQLNNANSDYY